MLLLAQEVMIDWNFLRLISVLLSCRHTGPELPAASAERDEGQQSGQVAAADLHVVHAERCSAASGVRSTSDGLGQCQRDPNQLQPAQTESGANEKQWR